MTALFPPGILDLILQQCPCRESQIRQLASIYNGVFPSPPVLVAYGLEYTDKTEVIVNVLEKSGIQYAVIKSRECLNQRHLLSKIFAACVSALAQESQIEQYDKLDSINALLGNLRRIFEQNSGGKFVIVLEEIDRLKQAGQTLIPALARLGDQIPGLSVILTSNSPRPLPLHKAGVPHTHFPPYTRSEAVFIVTSRSTHLLSIQSANPTVQIEENHISKLYAQFAVTVYDSLISSTSSTSIKTFLSTCEKLWPQFISPIVSGQNPTGTGKTKSWDFAKLLVHNRGLFQSEGEKALHDRLSLCSRRPVTEELTQLESTAESLSVLSTPSKRATRQWDFSATPREASSLTTKWTLAPTRPPLLKHFSTLVLLSSYLASHTFPKHDILLFSRLSSTSSSTSKKIRRLRQTPTKKKTILTPNGAPSKTSHESSTMTNSRTRSLFSVHGDPGTPRPFTLERLLAILRAIHPRGIPNRPGGGVSDRVYRELGELEKLRLVVRTWASGSGATSNLSGSTITTGRGSDDSGEEKWRVNVGRDWVVSMGHVWGMGVSEYEIEQDI
ncbi:uncharacterized protein Z518_00229 [Rhinocladiella mackenziei CBS 650.93]|uniref:Orc1-like AAA ATPase domain-containing protein n=1 Tax=Rhinocladiella mackenziei CBS 650.93 TaxID=1442369 RepID=A0A0D2J0H0_9EURO|nr:uncharacterized protein Z518_00229 [Rhinocladiella mackenziei CBS 650.93]KIX09151.1 hypothetical protein Z518_00229 [Rhinocladiella mackenziei CBS 650.93]